MQLSNIARQQLKAAGIKPDSHALICPCGKAPAGRDIHPLKADYEAAKAKYQKLLAAYKRRDRRNDSQLMTRALRNPSVAAADREVQVLDYRIRSISACCQQPLREQWVDAHQALYDRWLNRKAEIEGIGQIGFHQGDLQKIRKFVIEDKPAMSDRDFIQRTLGLTDSLANDITRIFTEEDQRQIESA
jgi:hypothetical protein